MKSKIGNDFFFVFGFGRKISMQWKKEKIHKINEMKEIKIQNKKNKRNEKNFVRKAERGFIGN